MPPSNNMGAENTTALIPSENRVLIDWLSWTVPTTDVDHAIKESGLSCLDFSECKHGGMGYKKSRCAGNVVVFYDGAENMGCHISMTGKGCRQYEALKGTGHCWFQLLVMLQNIKANITRLDLALDNVDGALDLDRLEESIRKNEIRTRFKKAQLIENLALVEEELDKKQGKTLYIGSPSSRIKIRFYDKAAQLAQTGHWVRCELQLMAERAQEAVKHLLANMAAGELATKVLNNYFAVITLDDVNRSRCSVQPWWSAWLETSDKLKLAVAKAIALVPEVMEHIKKQYSASLAMIKKYLGVIPFHEFMHEVLENGKEKLTRKHDIIIQCSRLEVEYPF